MHALAERFEVSVGSIVDTVGAAETALRTTAESMAGTAEEATAQTTAVAHASEEASANSQAVATGEQADGRDEKPCPVGNQHTRHFATPASANPHYRPRRMTEQWRASDISRKPSIKSPLSKVIQPMVDRQMRFLFG